MAITPFNEAPEKPRSFRTVQTNASGDMNTSEIDSYRQGVELTQDKHFEMGIVKLHAGYDNHEVPQTVFGQLTKYAHDPIAFEDANRFDSQAYLESQVSSSNLIGQIAYPIKVGDPLHVGHGQLDGVLEPLTIRARVGFFSIEDRESHSVYGDLQDGAIDINGASSRISQFYDMPSSCVFTGSTLVNSPPNGIRAIFGGELIVNHPRGFYLDGFESFFSSTLPGFINLQSRAIRPYTDGLTIAYSDYSRPTTSMYSTGTGTSYGYRSVVVKPGVEIPAHVPFDEFYRSSNTSIVDRLQPQCFVMRLGFGLKERRAWVD